MISLRRRNPRARRIRTLLTSLLRPCLLILLLTICASAQQSSGSNAPTDEAARLRSALSQALSKLEKAQGDLEAAKTLLSAQDEELKAAKDAFNAAKSEATAAEKTLEIADRAIAAQGRAMDAQEKAINNLLAISEKKDAQIDKLVARVDSANRRGMFGTLAGLALGIAAKVF